MGQLEPGDPLPTRNSVSSSRVREAAGAVEPVRREGGHFVLGSSEVPADRVWAPREQLADLSGSDAALVIVDHPELVELADRPPESRKTGPGGRSLTRP